MYSQIPNYSLFREQEPCSLFSCFSWLLCSKPKQELQAQFLVSGEPNDNCCCTKLLALMAIIAVLAVGILGANGAMCATSVGICAVALGGGSLLIALPTLRSKDAIDHFILGGITAAIVAFGALGIGGIVSAQAIGWTMIGSSVGYGILMCTDDPQKRFVKKYGSLLPDDNSD